MILGYCDGDVCCWDGTFRGHPDVEAFSWRCELTCLECADQAAAIACELAFLALGCGFCGGAGVRGSKACTHCIGTGGERFPAGEPPVFGENDSENETLVVRAWGLPLLHEPHRPPCAECVGQGGAVARELATWTDDGDDVMRRLGA